MKEAEPDALSVTSQDAGTWRSLGALVPGMGLVLVVVRAYELGGALGALVIDPATWIGLAFFLGLTIVARRMFTASLRRYSEVAKTRPDLLDVQAVALRPVATPAPNMRGVLAPVSARAVEITDEPRATVWFGASPADGLLWRESLVWKLADRNSGRASWLPPPTPIHLRGIFFGLIVACIGFAIVFGLWVLPADALDTLVLVAAGLVIALFIGALLLPREIIQRTPPRDPVVDDLAASLGSLAFAVRLTSARHVDGHLYLCMELSTGGLPDAWLEELNAAFAAGTSAFILSALHAKLRKLA